MTPQALGSDPVRQNTDVSSSRSPRIWLLTDFQFAFQARRVHPLDVLLHHATGGEPRSDSADRFLDDGDPSTRNAGIVAIVVRGNDFLLEEPVERVGVGGINHVEVLSRRASVDEPSVAIVVALGPPAVTDAQVRYAVQRRLHAARAAGFERLARVVQPDVA